MHIRFKLFLYIFIFALFYIDSIKATIKIDSKFIHAEKNIIVDNAKSLDSIYLMLKHIEEYTDSCKTRDCVKINAQVVSIVHLGDSHMQAGFFSVTFMNKLQERFGSAGRGLVVPLRLAKTNEPYDYLIRSKSQWNRSSCIQRAHKFPVGLGGLSIQTNDLDFSFEIKSAVNKKVNHSFNKITIFHHPFAPELQPIDSLAFQQPETNNPYVSSIQLDRKVNHLYLKPKAYTAKDSAIYYGFNLENGENGVLYHSIGINGAQFRHFANIDNLSTQIEILSPDLFIFSLGTNESYRGRLIESRFFAEIDRILKPLKEKNPNAKFIITTPSDCLNSSTDIPKASNPNINHVCNALIKYANMHDYAYWDLYSVLGGINSAKTLVENNILSRDGVHFKKDGYELLSELLYNAFLNKYNDYVRYRYK